MCVCLCASASAPCLWERRFLKEHKTDDLRSKLEMPMMKYQRLNVLLQMRRVLNEYIYVHVHCAKRKRNREISKLTKL